MLARGLGVVGARAHDSVHHAEGGLDGGERDQGGDHEGEGVADGGGGMAHLRLRRGW